MATKKEMGVVAALRYMAELWDKAEADALGFYRVDINHTWAGPSGLCRCLELLYEANTISRSTALTIKRLIDATRPHPRAASDFKWPRDAKGARLRAAWCRRWADRLTEEG